MLVYILCICRVVDSAVFWCRGAAFGMTIMPGHLLKKPEGGASWILAGWRLDPVISRRVQCCYLVVSCDVIWCAAVWWCVLCCVIVWVIMWWCGCWWCCSCCLHLGRHWESTTFAGFLSNISLLGLKHARWSLFHSCQCSVPSAEYSDSLEDDAMHCM